MSRIWRPNTWRTYPVEQQPDYADSSLVRKALTTIRALPPLVSRGEVDALRAHLAKVVAGDAFLLQGGDCAERFIDCSQAKIEAKLKILLQMSLILTWGVRIPVIRVGRIAGQYAKPRSQTKERVGGAEIYSYRGDHVNAITPTADAREPDPDRLVTAYFHSAATLNYIRALLDGGFADLHSPHHWDLGFVRSDKSRSQYEDMLDRILDALDFVESTGVHDQHALGTVELFASHEALLLPYEEAQTIEVDSRWYNLGAHMVWIGDRTRQLDGAHVEYCRGIENPVGIKISASMQPEDLIALLDKIEPENRHGRITLITRLGIAHVQSVLPRLIDAVQERDKRVVWSCDPMHGNTVQTADGLKTRRVEHILSELQDTFQIHENAGGWLGGVHFELTGNDVTECLGGPQDLSEIDLARSYETYCDPRLNYAQSIEMSFLIAQELQKRRSRKENQP